jgi:hypothetical protein
MSLILCYSLSLLCVRRSEHVRAACVLVDLSERSGTLP